MFFIWNFVSAVFYRVIISSLKILIGLYVLYSKYTTIKVNEKVLYNRAIKIFIVFEISKSEYLCLTRYPLG